MPTNSDNRTPLAPGTKLRNGAYSVGRVLRRDAGGLTYFGADAKRLQPVVVREFFPADATRQNNIVGAKNERAQMRFERARARFVSQNRALARLQHENLAPVIAIFLENGAAYVVGDSLRAPTLRDLLDERDGTLSVSEAVGYAHQIGEVLAAAHDIGLLHGAFGLSDVWLRPASTEDAERGARSIVLNWFGNGEPSGGGAALEEATSSGARGTFSDVYALAALLFELLTGQSPPPVLARAMGVGAPDPRLFVPRLDERIARATLAGLELRPQDRPFDVREWLGMLDGEVALPPIAPLSLPPGAELGASHGAQYTPASRGEAEILRQLNILFKRK